MKSRWLVIVAIGLIICSFIGCLPNVPTEGEPEPADRVVMIELFMAIGCGGCEVVEPILEQLIEEYGFDKLILVEEAGWGEYSTQEISDRYKWYLPDVSDRGVPNILFNGLNDRIHGSSSHQTIKNSIDAELAKGAKIVITATRNGDANTTTISGNIENVSSSSLNNLVINGMVFKEQEEDDLKYVTFDIFEEQKKEISSLESGESFNFSFTLEDTNWASDKVHGVIFVQSPYSSTKEILQAYYIE